MQAVDAAKGPEVRQYDLAAQILDRQRLSTGVQPTPTAQLGSTYIRHSIILPDGSVSWPSRSSRASDAVWRLAVRLPPRFIRTSDHPVIRHRYFDHRHI